MYASKQTRTLLLRDDEGAEVPVTIQKLSAAQLERAAKEKVRQQLADARDVGPELLQALRDTDRQLARTENRYDRYDRALVLEYGISDWGGAKLSAEQRADLDEETCDLVYRELIDLSVPTRDESEAAQAKG